LLKANKENAPIVPDYTYDTKPFVLKKPSKTGGQDLVHKKPRQRVRRTCHECSTLFTTGTKQCAKCDHTRCTDCPRDPYVPISFNALLLFIFPVASGILLSIVAFDILIVTHRPKKDKYPFGYPGDEFGPNAVPYHECHDCKTMYPPDSADGTECKKCQHQKCGQCPRLKPRKVEPEPDPEILKSIQAKIEGLKIK
jgi:hypothetical protein